MHDSHYLWKHRKKQDFIIFPMAMVPTSPELSCKSEYSMSSEELPYYFDLIQDKLWEKLRTCLRSSDAPEQCKQKDDSNLTCLALSLAQGAPLDIVEQIYNIDPSLLDVCDEFGATALHVGCLNGISVELIQFLLKKNKELAYELDYDQRSALHHAVEYSCSADVVDSQEKRAIQIDVIQILCGAAPGMVQEADSDGGTPVDLVQIIKAKTRLNTEKYQYLDQIYQVLKGISINVYRQQKYTWELQAEKIQKRLRQEELDRMSKMGLSQKSSSGSNSNNVSSLGPSISSVDCLMNLSLIQTTEFDDDNDKKIKIVKDDIADDLKRRKQKNS
jgi:hypothetical protein